MKKLAVGMGLLLAGVLALTIHAQDVTVTDEKPSIVVGTFDSRAVATSYRRSDMFKEVLRDKRKQLEEAKQAGNEDVVAELEAWGPEVQHQAHLQVFGSAPIDDVLAIIEDALPGIAAEAGVDVMVSKWRLAYEGPKAKFVDVTDLLVMLFDPDEETMEVIEELRGIDPLPAEEIQRHDH